MEHYVTLFDSGFLPQGLALHASLVRHGGDFTLWVLCLDDRAKALLDGLNKPTLRTIALSDIETAALRAVKSGRTRAEYCWTLTPFAPKAVFERAPDVQRVTYVDADFFFLKSPRPIFEEFERSGKAVLITDHAYDPEYDQSAASGQYCVQFVTFARAGEVVRKWWEERCVDWCFARSEDGRFGDQKYLEEWPIRFGSAVHVLQQLDSLLAPWNARRFPYSRAIAWHFHGLRLLAGNKVLLHGPYAVPPVVHQMIYAPYLEELRKGLAIVGTPVVQARVEGRLTGLLKRMVKALVFQVRAQPAVRRMP